MRYILPACLTLAFLAALGGMLWSGVTLWQLSADNRYIRALAAGQSPAPRGGAAGGYAVYADLLALARRDRAEDAEALLNRLAQLPVRGHAGPQLQAQARYAIGNARLRAGYELLDQGRVDEAVPHITLAKAVYRQALQIRPGDHDTRLNLALAMRLVRDLPRPEQSPRDDEDAAPRQLWTDLPGLPRGAP